MRAGLGHGVGGGDGARVRGGLRVEPHRGAELLGPRALPAERAFYLRHQLRFGEALWFRME